MSQVESFFRQLKSLLEGHASPVAAASMARYMKNQFDFYGIKGPERKALVRQCVNEQGMPRMDDLPALFRLCFAQEQREWQYVVNDLGQRTGPKMDLDFLSLWDELIAQTSWWDTVGPLYFRNWTTKHRPGKGYYSSSFEGARTVRNFSSKKQQGGRFANMPG